MNEYIITDEQAKEIVNQLPTYYVPTWLYLWVHTEYPYEPPNDWIQVREKHIGVNLPEIVRCRDCYFGNKVTWPTNSKTPSDYLDCTGPLVEAWDYYHDKPKDNPVPPDGFCAWGERKSE